MLTRDDFQQAIRASLDRYPSVQALYTVGDPRILQHLDAMATMLALYSAQIETALTEPFAKVRDATVLADASMRGLIPRSTPARAQVRISNAGTTTVALDAGRELRDVMGRAWRLETPAVIAPGTWVVAEIAQWQMVETTHTVSGSVPFYAIPIERAQDDAWISAIEVWDDDGAYTWRERYVNTFPDDRVYHIEADERQQVYVRFGFAGVVGVQPRDGQVITLRLYYALGRIDDLRLGSTVALTLQQTPHEARLDLVLETVTLTGESPHAIHLLRDIAKYPSIYNHNAVFLGEFEFLVRRRFPSLQFLSVWNEAIEERARGPSYGNINALFVACCADQGDEQVLSEPSADTPVGPEPIPPEALTLTQTNIMDTILTADNSYRVQFMTPVKSEITIAITATVSAIYVTSEVRQQIIGAIIAEYGIQSLRAKRGRNRPNRQRLYALLRAQVAALSVGSSDLTIAVSEPEQINKRPEMWRYVSASSLTVVVEPDHITADFWA